MKRSTKIAAITTAAVASVATMSVGFATWIIATQTEATATGNVKADSVTSANISMTAEPASDSSIYFGAPADMNIENAWLSNDGDATESLTVEFTLTINGNLNSLSVDFTVNDKAITGGDYGFGQAVNEGYITGPKYSLKNAEALSAYLSVSETGEFTVVDGGYFEDGEAVVVVVSFGWGAKFDYKNPYEFFNAKSHGTAMSEYGEAWSTGAYSADGSKANYAYANSELSKLYTYLGNESGLTYKFTFTALDSVSD